MIKQTYRFLKVLLQQWWVFIFASLVIVASSWPVLHPSFFRVHDFTQASRLGEMHRSLLDGQFPVRWSQNFGFGYGMPLFNFYGPLPYYIASLPMFIGFSAISSLKLFLVLLNVWSFWGAFKLGKKLFGTSGGLLVGTVFTLFPYRAVDLYARGAWNELSAMAFFPWVLYGVLQVQERRQLKYIIGLALSYFGVFCSHNLMTLMFLPVAYAWSLFWILNSNQKITRGVRLHVALFLGLGLSAFYTLPGFLEKGFTQVDSIILGGYFDYNNHFLFIRQWFFGTWGWGGSNYGPDDGLSFSLGIVTISLACVGVVSWFKHRVKARPTLYFFSIATFFALFLTIQKSSLIWSTLPLMEYFQFPWRFLSLVALTIAVLAGGVVYLFEKRPVRLFVSGVCCFFMIGSQFFHFRPESFLPMSVAEYDARERLYPGSVWRDVIDEKTGKPDLSLAMYYSDPLRIQTIISEILPDYIPKSVQTRPMPGNELVEVSPSTASASLEVVKNISTEKLVHVLMTQQGSLLWRVSAFPGWTAFVDGNKTVTYVTNEGWQKINVPEGRHSIRLVFLDTPIRRFANIISLISFCVIGGMVLHARRSRN